MHFLKLHIIPWRWHMLWHVLYHALSTISGPFLFRVKKWETFMLSLVSYAVTIFLFLRFQIRIKNIRLETRGKFLLSLPLLHSHSFKLFKLKWTQELQQSDSLGIQCNTGVWMEWNSNMRYYHILVHSLLSVQE